MNGHDSPGDLKSMTHHKIQPRWPVTVLSIVVLLSTVCCRGRGDRLPADSGPGDAGPPDAPQLDKIVLPPDQQPPDILPPDLRPPDTQRGDLYITDFGVAMPGTWKFIPAGSYVRGSPVTEPCRHKAEVQHKVTLTRSFWIMTTEVTQGQFKAVMNYNPSYPWKNKTANHPVDQVSWDEAAAYANGLSQKAGLVACYVCKGQRQAMACTDAAKYSKQKIYQCPGYRLPTDAEWEYAYRAGTTTAYYSGSSSGYCWDCTPLDGNLDKIGWYCANAGGNPPSSAGWPRAVGQKAPNAWGLYDMAGNLREWCHDVLTPYPAQAVTDPVGVATPPWIHIVVRGGSFLDSASPARAASSGGSGWARSWIKGFRLVRSVL